MLKSDVHFDHKRRPRRLTWIALVRRSCRCLFILWLTLVASPWASMANADRIKDLADVAGVRTNPLVGYGLVVGLSGSGDGNSSLTRKSIQSIVSRLGLETQASTLDARNTAAVIVTADLEPFLKPGQALDVTVSTVGRAQSLHGGLLLMTPLMGADGEVYAIAQGNLVVGGLGVEGGDGSSVVVNVPTVGRMPRALRWNALWRRPFWKRNSSFLICAGQISPQRAPWSTR